MVQNLLIRDILRQSKEKRSLCIQGPQVDVLPAGEWKIETQIVRIISQNDTPLAIIEQYRVTNQTIIDIPAPLFHF